MAWKRLGYEEFQAELAHQIQDQSELTWLQNKGLQVSVHIINDQIWLIRLWSKV